MALGTLVSKSLNNSYSLIYDTLPLDLTTRRLASYNKANSKDCASYVSLVTTDQSQVTAACSNHDFTNVDQLKYYVNATWYGDSPYMTTLRSETGLTEAETTDLFNPETAGSLGATILA